MTKGKGQRSISERRSSCGRSAGHRGRARCPSRAGSGGHVPSETGLPLLPARVPGSRGNGSSPGAAHAGRRRGKVSQRGDAEAARGTLLATVPVTDTCNNFKKWQGGWRFLVGNGESPGERRRRYFAAKLPKCYLLPVTRERDVKPGWLMLKQKLRG